MEKLTVAATSILCILIFAAAIVCVDIWNLKRELDELYSTTRRGLGISMDIERAESMLSQKLMELTLLVPATATVAVLSFISIRHKRKFKHD